MRLAGLIPCTILVSALAIGPSLADTANSLPLDRQIDLNLRQKADPMLKKNQPPVTKPRRSVSYDGVWLVTRKNDPCQSRIGEFTIRIDGREITTVVGMSVKGSMQAQGKFEMNAKTNYWSIKFSGKLIEETGRGKWTRTDENNNSCSGTIELKRVDG